MGGFDDCAPHGQVCTRKCPIRTMIAQSGVNKEIASLYPAGIRARMDAHHSFWGNSEELAFF